MTEYTDIALSDNVFYKTSVRHTGGSYILISLNFITKDQKTTFYFVFNFEENGSKIATMRVFQRKSAKQPP